MHKYVVNFLMFSALLGALWFTYQKFSSTKTQDNILLVGTNAEYHPFSTIENDEIVGFDIDLIKEIAHRLGKQIKIKNMPFDTLIPELQLGHINIIAAGMTATPKREKQMFFSNSYIKSDPLVAISTDPNVTIKTIEDLHNKRIVVNEGYTADSYLSQYEHLDINRLATPAEAVLALKSGRTDIFVTALSAIKPFLMQEKNKSFTQHNLNGISDSYAIAISKKYPELLKNINNMLIQLEEDGTIAALKQKWNIS